MIQPNQADIAERLLDEVLKRYDYNLSDIQLALTRRYNNRQTARPFEQPAPKRLTPTIDRSGKPLIKISNLSKTYKNGKSKLTAVDNVNLEIFDGEFVALTGTSGSGKSTLLHLIGGLDKPSAGSIVIDGIDIAKMNDVTLSNFRNKTIGFVFQFFYMQPFLNLAQNISVPSMVVKIKTADRKARINELAQAVGLADRLNHYPKELSGGQLQRAAIARALFNRPKIILADEPTGNLDSSNSDSVIELLRNIRQKFGTTIVIVTHDQKIAAEADREIIIKDGAIL